MHVSFLMDDCRFEVRRFVRRRGASYARRPLNSNVSLNGQLSAIAANRAESTSCRQNAFGGARRFAILLRMEEAFGGIFVLVFALLWTVGSVLPFVVIGVIVYVVVKNSRRKEPTNSRVATPFLSAATPVYQCEHCDSRVEKAQSCPNCGAPIEASVR